MSAITSAVHPRRVLARWHPVVCRGSTDSFRRGYSLRSQTTFRSGGRYSSVGPEQCVDLVFGRLNAAAVDGGALRRAGVDLDPNDTQTRAVRFLVDRSLGGALHLSLRHRDRYVDDAQRPADRCARGGGACRHRCRGDAASARRLYRSPLLRLPESLHPVDLRSHSAGPPSQSPAITAVVVAFLGFKDFAPTLRNHPEIRNMLTPANLLVSTARALRQRAVHVTAEREGPVTVSRGRCCCCRRQ